MMKRFLLIFFIIIGLIIIWVSQKRSYYCLENGKCITVWKKFGGKCYIIPGKYYGITKPDQTHLVTTNDNMLTFYWSAKLPDSYIIRNQGADTFNIITNSESGYRLLNYADNPDKFHNILYKENAKYFKDVKDDADYFDMDILDLIVNNKKGQKL